MVFTSPIFLFLFLPITLSLYFITKKSYRNLLLLTVSSLFYYFGEQNMLLLMYLVIGLNFASALAMDYVDNKYGGITAHRNVTVLQYRKLILIICVSICIALLWYYKYWNFSIVVLNNIFAFVGIDYKFTLADKIILPLGISFYIFHCLSYTFDVYYRNLAAERSFINFASYVMMFPQLVAGPIVRYIDIRYQFIKRSISLVGFANGIRRFCYGMAKKVLIANTVAKAVDEVFAIPLGQMDIASAWIGALCYTLQIYFDFSGYSDMAIGLAAMFGFHYKENFNYPYISKNISEFWHRWHISLSTWLRDYVYIVLGGNRTSTYRYYTNILLVFLLSGLWHGANTTFVLWGLWHGIFIIIECIFLKNVLKDKALLAHIYALGVIIFGWVLFRADTVAYGIGYWQVMLGAGANVVEQAYMPQNDVVLAMLIGAVLSYDWRWAYRQGVLAAVAKLENKPYMGFLGYKLASYAVALLLFVVSVASILSNTYNPFIYFRF